MNNYFFTILSDILTKQSSCTLHLNPEFKAAFSQFMLARYISMNDKLLPYAVTLNKYQNVLSDEDFYKLAYQLIPKQKFSYIKYISKGKKKKSNGSKSKATKGEEDISCEEL